MHRSFEENLDKLRTRLIRMGSLVEEQVEFAFRSLLENNVALAQLVIERDEKIDALDIKIDSQCQRIFALHQPVASDLRLLLAALKINNELERIGDMALDVARAALEVPETCELAHRVGLQRMTKATFTMVKTSLDAFVNADADLAKHLLPLDATVDALEHEITAQLVELMQQDNHCIRPGVRLIVVLRALERMADHATNIAENVIFLTEARLVRHRQLEEPAPAGPGTPPQP
ncbi:MAG: phosphate signaling complex protein PhoU [Candidatus Kapabacteria bacterium]|nr:phosphate signaling complex protein PhoU [Candidatus Kapabacteria bacterium]MDW7997680.1 phosphate signaling complex protein PhoU [Bacteroidota bacterium]MDW8224525.1 phosphate signaling complex protein PhoU [Bacteroidota bacterium]